MGMMKGEAGSRERGAGSQEMQNLECRMQKRSGQAMNDQHSVNAQASEQIEKIS